MLRRMEVGGRLLLDTKRCTQHKNLYLFAKRLKIQIAVREVLQGRDKGKLEVFRLR